MLDSFRASRSLPKFKNKMWQEGYVCRKWVSEVTAFMASVEQTSEEEKEEEEKEEEEDIVAPMDVCPADTADAADATADPVAKLLDDVLGLLPTLSLVTHRPAIMRIVSAIFTLLADDHRMDEARKNVVRICKRLCVGKAFTAMEEGMLGRKRSMQERASDALAIVDYMAGGKAPALLEGIGRLVGAHLPLQQRLPQRGPSSSPTSPLGSSHAQFRPPSAPPLLSASLTSTPMQAARSPGTPATPSTPHLPMDLPRPHPAPPAPHQGNSHSQSAEEMIRAGADKSGASRADKLDAGESPAEKLVQEAAAASSTTFAHAMPLLPDRVSPTGPVPPLLWQYFFTELDFSKGGWEMMRSFVNAMFEDAYCPSYYHIVEDKKGGLNASVDPFLEQSPSGAGYRLNPDEIESLIRRRVRYILRSKFMDSIRNLLNSLTHTHNPFPDIIDKQGKQLYPDGALPASGSPQVWVTFSGDQFSFNKVVGQEKPVFWASVAVSRIELHGACIFEETEPQSPFSRIPVAVLATKENSTASLRDLYDIHSVLKRMEGDDTLFKTVVRVCADYKYLLQTLLRAEVSSFPITRAYSSFLPLFLTLAFSSLQVKDHRCMFCKCSFKELQNHITCYGFEVEQALWHWAPDKYITLDILHIKLR